MKEKVEIYNILKQFYEISGFRVSIHDAEFNEIHAYPASLSAYCKTLQSNSAVLKECKKNDAEAFCRARDTGEAFVYKCSRGLYEAVAPIYHYGVLSGYLMIGQVCDESASARQYIYNSAIKVLNNKEKAANLASTVRSIPQNNITSYLGIMTVIAEYITETNRLYLRNKSIPQLIAEYIDKNYSSEITLSLLAQKFGCCNSTLTKSFRKEYGKTVITYLTDVRLEHAKKMMLGSEKTIKEIASECGFSDQNYFSRVFAEKNNCSPRDYRNRHGE